MSRTFLTRGLLFALALALLGACSSAGAPCSPSPCKPVCDPCAPPPCDPCPPPRDPCVPLFCGPCPTPCGPDGNICNWPDCCHPNTARDMLNQIAQLVHAEGELDALLQQRLERAIQRAMSSDLRNAENRHVCDLQDPLPCVELSGILKHAEDAAYPPLPQSEPAEVLFDENGNPIPPASPSPTQHWETIAQELEGFPTGR